MAPTPDSEGWLASNSFPVDGLATKVASAHLWVVVGDPGGPANDAQVRAPALDGRRIRLYLTAAGPYVVTMETNYRGQLLIGAERLTRRWISVRLHHAFRRMSKRAAKRMRK